MADDNALTEEEKGWVEELSKAVAEEGLTVRCLIHLDRLGVKISSFLKWCTAPYAYPRMDKWLGRAFIQSSPARRVVHSHSDHQDVRSVPLVAVPAIDVAGLHD